MARSANGPVIRPGGIRSVIDSVAKSLHVTQTADPRHSQGNSVDFKSKLNDTAATGIMIRRERCQAQARSESSRQSNGAGSRASGTAGPSGQPARARRHHRWLSVSQASVPEPEFRNRSFRNYRGPSYRTREPPPSHEPTVALTARQCHCDRPGPGPQRVPDGEADSDPSRTRSLPWSNWHCDATCKLP